VGSQGYRDFGRRTAATANLANQIATMSCAADDLLERYTVADKSRNRGLAAWLRIPTKPAMHSNSKPAGYSDLKPATRGVVRMGQFHDVVEGWEGQETG
jgi:hypothetical protein